MIKKIDPRENVIVYKYNGLNQMIEAKALGEEMDLITQYTYTAQGKIKTRKQELGSSWITTTYDYDRAGRKTAVHKPLDASSYYSCDKNGNWTGFTDAEGRDTVYGYNDLNQLVSVTNDWGVITESTIDVLGRRTAVTEAEGTSLERTTNFEYGNFDKMTKAWVTFNNQTLETTFSYDLFTNMTAQTDANGNGTSYTYDFLDLKASKTDAKKSGSKKSGSNLDY